MNQAKSIQEGKKPLTRVRNSAKEEIELGNGVTLCTDYEKLEWWISKGSGEAKCKARIGETGEDH